MKFFREPLVHFLFLGGLIFAAYYTVQGTDSGEKLVVTAVQQQNLYLAFERTWNRTPTAEEQQGLVNDFIRQELAVREALAMGLEEDDIIVRRRLRQKFDMLAQDTAEVLPPDDTALTQWIAEHPDYYRIPARYSLWQIYFNVPERGDAARQEASEWLLKLQADAAAADPAAVGDRIMLEPRYNRVSERDLDAIFGDGFAASVNELPLRSWVGPVESGFGLHLVYLAERTAGRMPDFAEVRAQAERDWFTSQRLAATDALYERLRARYEIVIEPPETQP